MKDCAILRYYPETLSDRNIVLGFISIDTKTGKRNSRILYENISRIKEIDDSVDEDFLKDCLSCLEYDWINYNQSIESFTCNFANELRFDRNNI